MKEKVARWVESLGDKIAYPFFWTWEVWNWSRGQVTHEAWF